MTLDCSVLFYIITAMIVPLLGRVGGLCNHTMAIQCLQTAEQQFQAAISNDFTQFCKSQKDNLELKRCLQRSTGSCDRATQDTFFIQAARFLRPIETQCSYMVSQNEHQKTTTSGRSTCRRDALPSCYHDLVTKFDADNDIQKAFQLMNPLVEWRFNQQNVCSKLEDVDIPKIMQCIDNTDCQHERVLTEADGNQFIQYGNMFSLLEGICQPECGYIGNRIQNANSCLRQDNIVNYLTGNSHYNSHKPSCDDLNKAFRCVRLNIQTCETGNDFLHILYNIASINPDIYLACPDLDASFYISKGSFLSYLDLSHAVAMLFGLYISVATSIYGLR